MNINNTYYPYQQFSQPDEKVFELARLIQIAAREVHAYVLAEKECHELREAQRACDKDGMWRLMQQHMRRHQQQIQYYGSLIGVTVIIVDHATYDQMTIRDVRNQINLLIGAIYAIRISKTSQKAFKERLVKLMKNSEKFTKQEIELVCSATQY